MTVKKAVLIKARPTRLINKINDYKRIKKSYWELENKIVILMEVMLIRRN